MDYPSGALLVGTVYQEGDLESLGELSKHGKAFLPHIAYLFALVVILELVFDAQY